MADEQVLGSIGLVVLLVGPVMGGCLAGDGVAVDVELPGPPAELAGTYEITSPKRDPIVARFALGEVPGERVELAPGASLTALSVGFAHEDEVYLWDVAHRTPTRLASGRMICLDTEGHPCGDPPVSRIVPDLWDAPAFFGLGPFLDESLTLGQTVSVDLWDPRTPVTVNWTVEASADHGGRSCVWLTSGEAPSAKTFLPVAPLWGRLRACDGIPVPVQIEFPEWTFTLRKVTHEGALETVEPERPAALVESGCYVELPDSDNRTLAVPDYMDWAEENDDEVRSWLDAHPDGYALPGYGHVYDPAPAMLSRSYDVGAILALHDPVGGLIHGRMARQDTTEGLQGTDRQMEQSQPLVDGDVHVRGLFRQPCQGERRPVPEVIDALLDRTELDARAVEVVLGPQMMASWSGTSRLHRPFSLYASTEEPFTSASWPERAYALITPVPDSNVVELRNAAADPTTGWPRWYEMHER